MKKTFKHILSVAVVMCLTIGSTTASAAVKDDEQAKPSELVVSYDTGRLIIKGVEEKTRIEVSNMLGVKVFSGTVSSSDKNDFNINLRKGIYIVRVGADVRRIAVK